MKEAKLDLIVMVILFYESTALVRIYMTLLELIHQYIMELK